MKCGRFYDQNEILESTGVPHCECGGVIKPDVVLYEESLNQKVLKEAVSFISHADVLLSLIHILEHGMENADVGKTGRGNAYRRADEAFVPVK